MLYKQQKFNLLREESEGFGKLVGEVSDFLDRLSSSHSPEDVVGLSNRLQAVIGAFDLDPNKALDAVFGVAVQHVENHPQFLVALFRATPWFRPSASGTPCATAATQIIGSRLRQSVADQASLDRSMVLIALMIHHGLLSMTEIWPHLVPEAAALKRERDAHAEGISSAILKAKGNNALTVCHRSRFESAWMLG